MDSEMDKLVGTIVWFYYHGEKEWGYISAVKRPSMAYIFVSFNDQTLKPHFYKEERTKLWDWADG